MMAKKWKITIKENRQDMAMAESTPRYDIYLNDEFFEQAYYNMRGYRIGLPTPDGTVLDPGEISLAQLKREVASLNREAKANSRAGRVNTIPRARNYRHYGPAERAAMERRYHKNEAINYHLENYRMMAEAFGSESEQARVKEIVRDHKVQGYLDGEDSKWLFDNINRYYREHLVGADDANRMGQERTRNNTPGDVMGRANRAMGDEQWVMEHAHYDRFKAEMEAEGNWYQGSPGPGVFEEWLDANNLPHRTAPYFHEAGFDLLPKERASSSAGAAADTRKTKTCQCDGCRMKPPHMKKTLRRRKDGTWPKHICKSRKTRAAASSAQGRKLLSRSNTRESYKGRTRALGGGGRSYTLAAELGVKPRRRFNKQSFNLVAFEDADPYALPKLAEYARIAGYNARIVRGAEGDRLYTRPGRQR